MALTVAALLLVPGSLVLAQTFRGVVIDDSTKRGLHGAHITLVDQKGTLVDAPPSVSDSAGRFTIRLRTEGRYAIRVTRIGYSPLTSGIFAANAGAVMDVTLRMSAVPQRLGTVIVNASRRLNGNELLSDLGFDLRRSKGNGKFFDSLDLAVFKQQSLNPLLADMSVNVWLRGQTLTMPSGLTPNATMKYCAPSLWIDGILQEKQWRLQGMNAEDLYGLEVFGPHQIPPPSLAGQLGAEQALISRSGRCGLIVLWTKLFVNDRLKKGRY